MSSHSKSEIICQGSFDEYLTSRFTSSIIEWSDGDEPPDYNLTLDGKRFAAEVTALIEQIKLGSEEVSIDTISKSLWRMVDEVEREATIRGALSGCYIIYLLEPIEKLSKRKNLISQRILDYVVATKTDESFPQKVLLRQGGIARIAIAKRASQPSLIAPIESIDDSDGWEGDLRATACKLLQTAITVKSQKMSHLALPKILLLLNHFPLVDFDYYSACVPEVTGLNTFSAVFVVGFEEKGYMIHSSKDWH